MTEARFNEKLGELVALNPNSPYLADLKRGYSVVNVVYIQLAFSELGQVGTLKQSVSTPSVEADIDNLPTAISGVGDAVLLDFDDTRRELYRRLYATRKRFFEYPFSDKYNADRACVSADVQTIQRQIATLKKAIERYIEKGELPQNKGTEGDESVFVLPTDPFKLIKTQGNLRSSLSRIEREIKQLAGMKADPKRIDGKEKTRVQLMVKLQKVREAIEGKG